MASFRRWILWPILGPCLFACDGPLLGLIISEDVIGSHTQAPYELHTYLPPGHSTDAAGLPLVLILDGDMGFYSVAEIAELAASEGRASPAVLLGVGNSDWRGLDLTPTVVDAEPSGGIADFFAWIETELVASVETTYGCGGSPDLRVVTGHSYGGLATTWTLFHRQEFWGRFGASSPSLWWDDRMMFSEEEQYNAAHDTLPVHAYYSMGAIEVSPMNIDFNTFVDRLENRDYEGLQLTHEVLYGHEHYSSFDPAFNRTLEVLIPPEVSR